MAEQEWVQRIFRAVTPLLPHGFVGKIELNCVNGAIGNIVVNQSHKERKGENST